MVPGEIITAGEAIRLNQGRASIKINVANQGDRAVQVGSHYHFFETNEFLAFERKLTYGCRLNIASGTAVRFEPGQARDVEVISYDGLRRVFGFNGVVNAPLTGD